MSRSIRAAAVLLVLAMPLAFAIAPGEAGSEKAPKWKPFLPATDYKELSRRAVERIRDLSKDEDGVSELRAEALILAGYTLSAKDAKASARMRQSAVQLAVLAGDKDFGAKARKVAADFGTGKGEKEAALKVEDWTVLIGDIKDLMTPFRSRAKGGEGIAIDLRYSAKLKKLNGIEAFINALALKKLSATNLGNMGPELELLGYRVATIGALTLRRGPANKKKAELRQWDEQAILMRDSAVDLAEGARRKDAVAVFSASKRLEATCFECHSNFK